jgi:Winged helix-turn helix
MRTGVTLSVSSADLERLRAVVCDRNAPQKHVWRARIVLLSAQGLGTNALMRETGRSKTCVWRWQERFASEGFEGLLRDKTRPSRIKKFDPSIAERVVALMMEPPLAEATHWTGRGDGSSRGHQRLVRAANLARPWAAAASGAAVQAVQRPRARRQAARRGWALRRSARTPSSFPSTRRARSRRSTEPSRACR